MKKEQERHEKRERKRKGQTVPYKKGAKNVMPCEYKKKGMK